MPHLQGHVLDVLLFLLPASVPILLSLCHVRLKQGGMNIGHQKILEFGVKLLLDDVLVSREGGGFEIVLGVILDPEIGELLETRFGNFAVGARCNLRHFFDQDSFSVLALPASEPLALSIQGNDGVINVALLLDTACHFFLVPFFLRFALLWLTSFQFQAPQGKMQERRY